MRSRRGPRIGHHLPRLLRKRVAVDVGDIGTEHLLQTRKRAAGVHGDRRAHVARDRPFRRRHPRRHGQRQQLFVRREILLAQPADVVGIFVLWTAGAAAERVHPADARLAESLNGRVCVRRGVADVRPVEHRRHTRVDRAERTHQIADVDVLGTDHPAHGAQDVAHVVVEQTVGQAVADRALPHVPVRVDEPRHDDHVRSVDHLRVGADVRLNRGDQAFLDQHVGGVEVADLRIEREDASALEQHATGLRCCRRAAQACRHTGACGGNEAPTRDIHGEGF